MTLVLTIVTGAVRAQTVQDFARLGGESESVIQGLGLVMGLQGTGDDGEYIPMAAPLLAIHANMGNPVPSMQELEDTNSVALVMVMARVPPEGAKEGDELDAEIMTIGSSTSLAGGTLYLSPMRGPLPGDPVYAFASGRLTLEDNVSTNAVLRRGVTMTRDVRTVLPRTRMELRVLPEYASFSVATELASRINQEWYGTTQAFGEPVARAVDARTIDLAVPADQASDIPAFLADILATPVNAGSLRLPATVRVNRVTGAIIATADVTIGAVAITHKDLVITTTVPEPVPTRVSPLVERSNWASVGTGLEGPETARLADLTQAFEQLDVPAAERVEILQMLHRTGRLHARLVIEGSDQ
ncbi:MAG: flagellar basal body P-ring protein FlgI [Planctomycetota bacterium]